MPGEDTEKIVLRRWAAHYYYFVNGELPDKVIHVLQKELSYFVKNAERTDAFKKGTWNGQETLFYKTKKGVHYFPAGLLPQVTSVLKAYAVPYVLEAIDVKEHLKKYPSLNLEWYGPKLRNYQLKSISDLVMRGGGVLSLPTGGGKTLIAMKIMQMYDVPTLIVVHRRELMRQWIKEIQKNLHYQAARYGAGVKDHFEYITVGLMQSLIKYKGNLDFPLLIADECLPYSARVITDRGSMEIGDIVENHHNVRVLTHNGKFKRVVGYQKIPRLKKLARVTHEYGDLTCTEDHKILTHRGFIESGLLKEGDVIYHVQMQDVPPGVFDSGGAGRACEISQSRTDETDSRNGQEARGVERCNRADFHSAATDTRKLDWGHEPNIFQEPRELYNKTSEAGCYSLFRPARVRNVEILDTGEHSVVRSEDIEKLGVVSRGSRSISIFQQDARMLDPHLQSDTPREDQDDKSGVVRRDYRSDSAGSVVHGRWAHSEAGEVCKCVSAHAGNGAIRNGFISGVACITMGNIRECSPNQGREIVGKEDVSPHCYSQAGRCKCVSESGKAACTASEIDALQASWVYDITVEDDHTFVADGIVVSNCHHVPANTLYSISMNCNAAVRLGLSATPRREQGDEMKIWAAMGNIASDVHPTDLIKAGFIAKPNFIFLKPKGVNISRGAKWHQVYLDGIVTSPERNSLIVDTANELLDEGLLTYIHVERIDHGEYLADHIEGATFVCGNTPKRMRDHTIDSFTDGKRRCLVSTLLGEGVDIPSINALIMAGGLKTTTGAIQKIGRALRVKEGKDSAIIVDFVDSGKYLAKHWGERYEAYKSYYGEYCPDFAIGK